MSYLRNRTNRSRPSSSRAAPSVIGFVDECTSYGIKSNVHPVRTLIVDLMKSENEKKKVNPIESLRKKLHPPYKQQEGAVIAILRIWHIVESRDAPPEGSPKKQRNPFSCIGRMTSTSYDRTQSLILDRRRQGFRYAQFLRNGFAAL